MVRLCHVASGVLRFASAVAAVVGFLSWSVPAQGVYYEDVPDAPITYDGLLLRFVDSEIFLQRNTVTQPDLSRTITYAFPSYGDSGVAVRDRDGYDALGFSLGEPIGPAVPWTRANGRLVYTTCPVPPDSPCESTGDFAGASRYLGIVFRNELGAYHGWARISQAGGDALAILHEFAIETTPNLPILAGSRDTLHAQMPRVLRCAAGIDAPSPEEVALLDRAGEPGRLDLCDATVLARLMAPPSKGD